MSTDNTTPAAESKQHWDAQWSRAVGLLVRIALDRHGIDPTGQHRRGNLTEQHTRELDRAEMILSAGYRDDDGEPVTAPWTRPRLRQQLTDAALRHLADRFAAGAAAQRAAEAALTATRGHGTGSQYVADEHWLDSGRSQTLADFIAALPRPRQAAIAECLRLLFACAAVVGPLGGGCPPPAMRVHVDIGRVDREVRVEDLPDEDSPLWQDYVAVLPVSLRRGAREANVALAHSWNRLTVPERRVVLVRWGNLRLKTDRELAAMYGPVDAGPG